MLGTLSPGEEAQLMQTIEMFEVITQSQPQDYQSLEILKEAYLKLGRQKDVINTSKRIAQAYVQLGQLSSAILEYETILQRYPDDPDVLAALADLESRANSLTAMPVSVETDNAKGTSQIKKINAQNNDVDDGKEAMRKLFVDGKLISAGDFEVCWSTPSLTESPGRIIDPFLQVLHDKSILQVEKSLKALSDKTRMAYIPLEKYDVDMDVARSFPKDACQRWCVAPFDKMSKTILVATSNPFNKKVIEDLQGSTPHRLLWYLASPSDLNKVLKKIFR